LILADTSVWIDHFRTGNREMRNLLDQGQIALHPFIVGELALGSLRNRASALALLDVLPHVFVARMDEVRAMIETRQLYSLGIGLIDAHLIASAFLSPHTRLWTKDKQLRKVAEGLSIHANLS
jgi:predicted nucleic acid-binding protein